jgi:hypothetical protein
MPTINLTRKQSNSVINEGSSSSGDGIVNTSVGGASFISEDLSKQIAPSNIIFNTSFEYLQYSLEVFINGMKLSVDVDFEENLDKNSFTLKELDIDLNRLLQANSYIFVKYIKK